MLRDLADALGDDRPAVACRELTKTYEEVRRSSLGELADWAGEGVKGELTLVVAGAPQHEDVVPTSEALAAQVDALVESGHSKRDAVDAVAAVAQETGVPKREVYDAVVAAKSAAKADGAPH
jgi:16S rRNA (cytidine1402-2'-O)-methyltransferase